MAVAAAKRDRFPIVGIGASAGGLAAFEAFFSGMPQGVEPGMAFVLVQHLAPEHTSILAELVGRYTTMPVVQVAGEMQVAPNHVYIIPPNQDMAILDNSLHLLKPFEPRGHRLPIDYFFRSLAKDQKRYAIAVVLSGSGRDGTQGARAIKAEDGMVLVQRLDSAEFDGMPRSVVAAGLADLELEPAAMLPYLIEVVSQTHNARWLSVDRSQSKWEQKMREILVLLHTQTGHDFSQYKPSTIYRRVERRMAVHQIESIQRYVQYLQESLVEVEALFCDMLIGVTSFFRDPEIFEMLESHIIPQLFKKKSDTSNAVRVWVCGCSTGEEAYSIAILIREYLENSKSDRSVQIFATDLDSRAVAAARTGTYPLGIASDVRPDRLSRFFSHDAGEGGYRIHKSIREMLVFSVHDVIKDPPFSKLDLISCRNLLIYLNSELQKKLMPIFHFALNQQGILLLGSSEGIGDATGLFSTIDRKTKLFRRTGRRVTTLRKSLVLGSSAIHSLKLPSTESEALGPMSKLPLREILEKSLMRLVAPSAALVNSQGDILYLHGRTGMYLEPLAGEASVNNILKMAREGLQHELTTALRQVVVTQVPVNVSGLLVRTNGHYTRVELNIIPITPKSDPSSTVDSKASELYLVTLRESSDAEKQSTEVRAKDGAPFIAGGLNSSLSLPLESEERISALLEELRTRDDYLQSAREDLESSNEELKFSNEELQSVNEELQSTNEELETSKEELQSVNEELATVNMELQAKVENLSQLNNDMNNLLSGTGIATVFVDHHLRLLRFTPTVCAIINLISTDVGRPIAHTVTNLVGYDRLVQDAQEVLDTLVTKVIEVQTKDAKWYTMRMQPYRTIENVIEGAVINFVDISSLKRAQEELESDKVKLQFKSMLLNAIGESVIATDLEGTIKYWNEAAERTYGSKASEVEGKNIVEVIADQDFNGHATQMMAELIKGKSWTGEFVARHRDGHRFPARVTHSPILDGQGKLTGIIGVSSDITAHKNAEESLRRANELARLAVVVRDSRDAITVQELDGRIVAWNPAAVKLFGWSESEALRMNARDRIPMSLRKEALVREYELSQAEVLEPFQTQRLTKNGSILDVWVTSTALVNEEGHMHAIATTERARLPQEK